MSATYSCKIAEFGHACAATGDDLPPLVGYSFPARWMAPEALLDEVFSSQSDVWSFGVTLWEIMTYGATPYHGGKSSARIRAMSTTICSLITFSTVNTEDLPDFLQQGHRLERPQNCRPSAYRVMASCWVMEPRERPSFTDLKASIDAAIAASAVERGGTKSGLPPIDVTLDLPPYYTIKLKRQSSLISLRTRSFFRQFSKDTLSRSQNLPRDRDDGAVINPGFVDTAAREDEGEEARDIYATRRVARPSIPDNQIDPFALVTNLAKSFKRDDPSIQEGAEAYASRAAGTDDEDEESEIESESEESQVNIEAGEYLDDIESAMAFYDQTIDK